MTHSRPMSVLLAAALVVAMTTPVLAARPAASSDPTIVGGGPAPDEPWIPPTEEEQAILDAKLAMAHDIAAATTLSGKGGASQQSFCAAAGLRTAATTSCVYVPSSHALPTYARQQATDWYCGPATAQVIINYSRGYFSSNVSGTSTTTNYRTQAAIAKALIWWNSSLGRWENTDTIKSTNAYMLKAGLNSLARLPSGFGYGVWYPASGSDWHSMVITDTYQWKMPFGTPVKMTSSSRRLSSWKPLYGSTVVTHWIPIRGYRGFWDGSDSAQVYFNDSSAYQGGGTGSYVDSSLKVYTLNQSHTRRVVW